MFPGVPSFVRTQPPFSKATVTLPAATPPGTSFFRTGPIRQLAERYANPLPQLVEEVEALATKVAQHLKKMGIKT